MRSNEVIPKLARIKKPTAVWVGALLLCLAWNYCTFMKVSTQRDQPYIAGWDNNLYFAWGRSLALDGDLDFANDFSFVANWKGGLETQTVYARFLDRDERTPIGRLPNITGVGFGLASVPLLLAARGMAAIHSGLTGIRVSPFAAVYCVAFIFTSILISFAGLAVTFRILRERFGGQAAFCAMVVGMLGLSTGYYVWFDPTMAQAPEFGFSAFFIAMMLRWHDALQAPLPGWRRVFLHALGMGLMLGVCCMTRFPALALAVAPIVLAARFARERLAAPGSTQKARGELRWVKLLAGSAVFATCGALLGFLPQMLAWKSVYGSWFVNSYDVTVQFRARDVWHVFFDSRIGLFLWTPLAALAVGGLFAAAWNGDSLSVAGCAVFLVFIWEFSSCDLFIPTGPGHAFGMRYFVDGAFLFFLGLAAFFRWFETVPRQSMARRALLAGITLLIAWNLFLAISYRADIQPHGKPLAFKPLFQNWRQWRRQVAKDVNMPKRLFEDRFPLFTPL